MCHFRADFETLDLDPPNNPTSHYGACHFGYNLALIKKNWWLDSSIHNFKQLFILLDDSNVIGILESNSFRCYLYNLNAGSWIRLTVGFPPEFPPATMGLDECFRVIRCPGPCGIIRSQEGRGKERGGWSNVASQRANMSYNWVEWLGWSGVTTPCTLHPACLGWSGVTTPCTCSDWIDITTQRPTSWPSLWNSGQGWG